MTMSLRRIAASGSFRRQVILTFVIGFFIMISAFAAYMVKTEGDVLYRSSGEDTNSLAESLAVSSLTWVLANDVVGLQEVVQAFRSHPQLRYAMILSPAGRVLAHTDIEKVGQFASDEQSLALLRSTPTRQVVTDSASVVEVAVPIMLLRQHVGWARVAQDREWVIANLRGKIIGSAIFVLLATALALVASLVIVNRLGSRVASLVRVAEAVRAGDFSMRVNVAEGGDETTSLGDSFNRMLDTLARDQRALRAASLYNRSLIEASPDPLVTINAEGKITDVNQATEQVTGRGRAELIGTDFSDYFTEPDKARAGYREVFAQGSVIDYPLAIRHRDGRVTEVLYNASVYRDEAGDVAGVFAAARDITERKQAEAARTQLAAIVESSDDAIISKTLDNIITSWNRGAEQMYGYTAREAIGQPVSLIVPEDEQQELHEFNERIKHGERVDRLETVRVDKDGRRIEVSLSLSPIFDERGVITGISAIARDITERERAEELIRKNNQLLETVFSSIHVMIAYLDRDFNFIKVNKAYAAADQRTPDFFPGKNHFDLYPNEENEAIFRKAIERGEAVVYYAKPFRYAGHPERGVSYWDWRLEPIKGAGGKVEGLIFSLLDVTEQTQAMQKIQAASLYARSLIEASLDPLVTISAEGKITDVNEATEQATGRSRAELVGTDFSDYFTEPDKARAGYRQVFEKGLVRDYPLEVRHRDGRSTPVLYNATLYKDARGQVAGIFAAARDITEKKRAEEALRESERFLDSVVEHIPNMLFVKEAGKLSFVRFNKAGEELLGYTRQELLGKSDRDFFPKEEADFFISKDREILERGELLDIPEEPISTRHLGQRYLHTRKIPIFADDGTPLYLLGISEDVTERKLADEQLRRSREGLAEAQRIAHLGNWELDLVNNALTWSDEIYRIFEIDREKFGASYEAFLDAIHPDDRDMVNKAYTESVRNRNPYDIVHRLLMKDGRVKYVNEKCETYYGEDGKPLRSVGTVHDITDLKTAEARISELNRDLEKRVVERTAQLEAANKELEAFSYSVSHDLRTPLRAIDGFSHILLDDYAGKLDDEGRRLLNVVRDNAGRMGQLIDDILKFSRAGRLGMTYSEIDMEALAREVCEELQPVVAGPAKVEIGRLPQIRGDRAMLHQVYANLLSNAIKFSRGRESPKVVVGGDIQGDEAMYYVRDNGVGFDMQYVDKLFGVFQRLHGVEEFEGTGIGLAIVKRIVTRHGGRVWAEGKVGEGATIYFSLPIREKKHG